MLKLIVTYYVDKYAVYSIVPGVNDTSYLFSTSYHARVLVLHTYSAEFPFDFPFNNNCNYSASMVYIVHWMHA